MKTIYIASSAWLNYRSRCEIIIDKIICTGSDGKLETIVLDAATIRREADSHFGDRELHIIEIDLRSWVNESLTEGGVINIEAIRRATTKMTEDKIYAINATGFDTKTILRALFQLRIGFYTLSCWPRGLILVSDDSQMHQVSPVLANTFYIQPSIIGKVATKSIVRQIVFNSYFTRFFGRPSSFTLSLANHLHNWITKRQKKGETSRFYEE